MSNGVDTIGLLEAATARFRLEVESIHGPEHWLAVHRNGLHFADRLGADKDIVQVFALVHDCCRENEWHDRRHGYRAAQFAGEINDRLLGLSPERLDLLQLACTHHDTGAVSDEPTLDACWSADRVELVRVGVEPDRRFFTAASWRVWVAVSQAVVAGGGEIDDNETCASARW